MSHIEYVTRKVEVPDDPKWGCGSIIVVIIVIIIVIIVAVSNNHGSDNNVESHDQTTPPTEIPTENPATPAPLPSYRQQSSDVIPSKTTTPASTPKPTVPATTEQTVPNELPIYENNEYETTAPVTEDYSEQTQSELTKKEQRQAKQAAKKEQRKAKQAAKKEAKQQRKNEKE